MIGMIITSRSSMHPCTGQAELSGVWYGIIGPPFGDD